MTASALQDFLSKNQNIEWFDDVANMKMLFRNTDLPKYANDKIFCTAIEYWKLDRMTGKELYAAINSGFNVYGITRITGYFSTTNRWNPGKMAELRDRHKTDLEGRPCVSMCEICDIQEQIAAIA